MEEPSRGCRKMEREEQRVLFRAKETPRRKTRILGQKEGILSSAEK
jgi:hypothetical protein